MTNGYHGKILKIDLSNKKTEEIPINEEDVKKYFMGSGLSAKILSHWKDIENIEPLSPQSQLIFMAGLFTGTTIPASSKLSVCAKSPLTGIWNEATVGGHWPATFKFTGFDGMIITGKSEKPVYLCITEEKIEIRDASHLWAKDTYITGEILAKELGDDFKICTIGPSGENLTFFASIIFDPPISRVAARGGIGAVMGSKNLKAIAVKGKKIPNIANKELLKELLKAQIPKIKEFTVGLTNFGTSGGVETVEMYGDLPIKNWQLGSWKEGAKKIAGQAMQPLYLDRHYSCFSCPIRCAKIYKVPERNLYGHGPEYETIGMLGSNCLNDNPLDLIEANELCNKFGMDTISCGHLVSFAIEAFERGIITEKETGGLKLEWGGKSVVELVKMIGKREHIGDILALGVRRAALTIGKNAQELAVEVKGLEIPGHDPRAHVGMSLNYATAVRGGCHLEALTYFLDRGIPVEDLGYTVAPDSHRSDDKPQIVVNMQNYLSCFNPLGLCKFLFIGRVGPKIIAQWLNAVCGFDFTMDDVMRTGERLVNLKRMFDVRLGISRKDDVLPPRMFAGAKPDGKAKGVLADLGNMLYAYYNIRKWDEFGIPTKEKLRELGIP
ncbi:MAG: aldehyde ferredoxin oxidoreductase family protein [Candidatus Hydrogenedentota bacterium]